MDKPTAVYTYSGLVRIDDRLVHGQVLVNWVRALALARLVVVDDVLAADEVMRSTLGAVVPGNTRFWLGSAAAAVVALPRFAEPVDKHLVLVASPINALRLYDAGVHYLRLNVGCLGAAVGRARFFPQVSLALSEYAILASLVSRGVEVISQPIPSAPIARWPEIQAQAARVLPQQMPGL